MKLLHRRRDAVLCRRRVSRLGLAVALLGAVLVLAVLAAAVWEILDRRAAAFDAARYETTSLSRALAEQTSRTFEAVDLVLKNLVAQVRADGIASPEAFAAWMSTPDTHALLRDRAADLSQIDVLAVVRADGKLINFSRYWPIPEIDNSDRDYFKAFRDDPSLKRYIGERGLARSTGTQAIYLARRVNAPDGTFLGLVVGALQVQYFEDFYRAVSEGEGRLVVLRRRDGTLLARYPDDGLNHEADVLSIPALRELDRDAVAAKPASGGITSAVPRLRAVRTLKDFPLVVIVSRSETAINAVWQREADAIGIGAVVAAAALALATILLAQKVMDREASEVALRRHRDELEHEVMARTVALATSEARHRDVADLASDWFWETDAMNRFSFVSSRLAEALGIGATGILGQSLNELESAGFSRQGLGEILAAIEMRDVFHDVIHRVSLSYGRTRYWRMSGTPFLDVETGAFAGYRGVGTDVTAAIRREEALTAALARAEAAQSKG